MITQEQTDLLTARVKTVVEHFGQGHSALTPLHYAYHDFHKRPDTPSYALVEIEVEKLEKQIQKENRTRRTH